LRLSSLHFVWWKILDHVSKQKRLLQTQTQIDISNKIDIENKYSDDYGVCLVFVEENDRENVLALRERVIKALHFKLLL
jgi:hypothetical protein